MDALTLEPAVELTYGRLSRLLNRAYGDYFVPVWLDPYQFEQMCEDMDVDLARSVVALLGERAVGLALLSVRGAEGWISGVGVRPGWRRRGVGRRMIEHLQALARNSGLERLRLEVLEQNKGAIALYEDLGFRHGRDLLVLTKAPDQAVRSDSDEAELSEPGDRTIKGAPPRWLLGFHARFHEVDPSWQRDLLSLENRAPRLEGLAFWKAQDLVGYCLYVRQPDLIAVMDLAAEPACPNRVRAGERLLRNLHQERPTLGGQVVNLPAEDPMLPAFTGTGYRVWQRQHEMVWLVPHPT